MKIKFTIVALLISFINIGAVQAQDIDSAVKSFNITSKNKGFFAFGGSFEGDYRVLSDKIELTVKDGNILLRDTAPYKGRRKLAELRVGLATTLPSGRWKIISASKPVKIEEIMAVNQDLNLSNLEFIIPKGASIDLSKHWLIFEMSEYILDKGEQEARIRGTSYAHSSRNIFGTKADTNAEYKEDCLSYDVASLQIVNLGEKGWRLTDGRSSMLILDNETDANAALALAKKYKQHCFIGRGNKRPDRVSYIVDYWK